MTTDLLPIEAITQRIFVIRGQKVLLDSDLAQLYGVQTKVLNQAVKRNVERFPADFMFQLTADEKKKVVTTCDHLSKLKFSRALPFAFTEHGAIQASNVLASTRAAEMGVYVVRAFVKLRALASSHQELAKRLEELEEKSEALALKHDAFAHNTRMQLKQIFLTIRALMTPPEPSKQPIGFVRTEEKKAAKEELNDSLET